VVVAASGNFGSFGVLYPAAYPHVIAVAATDAADTVTALSNYGPEVSVAAPGDAIYSAALGGGYVLRSGTSMAAPYVSGLAAILVGIPGSWSPTGIRNLMQSTALDLGAAGRDDYYGYGLIQMDRAIKKRFRALAPPPPTETDPALPAESATPADTPTAFVLPLDTEPPGGLSIQQPAPTETFTPSPTPTATGTASVTPTTTVTPTPGPARPASTIIETPAPPPSMLRADAWLAGWLMCAAAGLLVLILGLVWMRLRAAQ
jgi:subtilisin family serine protease